MDRENTDYAVSEAESKTGTPLTLQEYDDIQALAAALYAKEVGAAIINQAYVDVLEDMEAYSDFKTETRVLESVRSCLR